MAGQQTDRDREGVMESKSIGCALAIVAALAFLAAPAAALEVGQKAPDFTLAGPGGTQVRLADLLGKGPVVVYTFIQAFTGT
jgi:peroxiredoxin Q/BCP